MSSFFSVQIAANTNILMHKCIHHRIKTVAELQKMTNRSVNIDIDKTTVEALLLYFLLDLIC